MSSLEISLGIIWLIYYVSFITQSENRHGEVTQSGLIRPGKRIFMTWARETHKNARCVCWREIYALMAGSTETASYARRNFLFLCAEQRIGHDLLWTVATFFNPLPASPTTLVARHRPHRAHSSSRYVLRYRRNAVT